MATLNIVEQGKMFIELLNDDDDPDGIRDVRRRGSNVSLSRYRSCPQLLDELNINQSHIQSFEVTADDSTRARQPLSPQSPAPLIRRHFQFDQNGLPGSATPTPPSTPRSRRSVHSQKDSPSTPIQGLSPVSTPRLLTRKRLSRPSLSRDSSGDSQNDGVFTDPRNNFTHVPFNEENVKRHEQLSSAVVDTGPLRQGVGEIIPARAVHRKLSQQHTYLGPSVVSGDPSTECSQDKCEKWLQSFHLSKPEKIKSRSHIQLPPV